MKSASKKRYGRGTEWSKMTTAKLEEICNHPHALGVDGEDYGPYLHELQSELYKRQNAESERTVYRWMIDFKKQEKYERDEARRLKRKTA